MMDIIEHLYCPISDTFTDEVTREMRHTAAGVIRHLQAKNERMRTALLKARAYIAGERTVDRPKDATLEIIDRALDIVL